MSDETINRILDILQQFSGVGIAWLVIQIIITIIVFIVALKIILSIFGDMKRKW